MCQACRFLKARNACGRLGDSEIGAVMGRMLQMFAKEGRCPEHELLDDNSGAKLPQDLGVGLKSDPDS